MQPQNIMEEFPSVLSLGVRVQMLINRGISNSNTGSKRWVNKLVSTSSESFVSNCQKLLDQMCFIDDPDVRLYASVNSRCIKKAKKEFMHQWIDAQDDSFFLNAHNKMISALMKPECRDTSYYLIDVDTKEPKHDIETLIGSDKVVAHYPTPNGFHFVTHGFDTRVLKDVPDVEIKRDGLMLLASHIE